MINAITRLTRLMVGKRHTLEFGGERKGKIEKEKREKERNEEREKREKFDLLKSKSKSMLEDEEKGN